MNDPSNITLRLAQDEDLNHVARLDRLAFAPLRANADVIRDWYPQGLELPDRTQFLAVEATTNQAVGAYVQIDLELLLQQKRFPTLGLAGVAVAPERRGQRVARRMIEHALETGRSHQYPLAMLYPFQHGFYRKLGWAWVGRSHQYRVSTTHLPRYSEPQSFATAGLTGIFPYDATQQQALQTVYQTAAVQHNGWIQRREWLWDSLLKPKTGREIYTYVEAGALLGYVVLQFTQLPDRLAVVVREWVALTSTAYRSILGFLASLRDQVSTIVWNTFAEDPFPHLLSEQRRDPSLSAAPFEFGLTHAFGEIGGGFMWRLVDVQRAFEQRPVQAIDPFA
ncbi:GNAT family N-acetyltransferase, partial [Leptolyngbya sp. FACHB-36]|uniref:GNAT family N-acetyltransferase n=1 Tax=Leptolyngbya sp. FACHB-36 TaxID=2692808 RepID=UPI0016814665